MEWHHVPEQYVRNHPMVLDDALQQLPIINTQEEQVPPVEAIVAPAQEHPTNWNAQKLIANG